MVVASRTPWISSAMTKGADHVQCHATAVLLGVASLQAPIYLPLANDDQ